ncbi:DUF805 domain-containing protein [Lactobacillus salivarius]|jgi:uncharacterized membrane protein YhaH (DUF805 family)|uniref:DUF805 domain-containing protein n=2 Tax=Ligilactobacillus salivarius TaxID=1624 RepID=A0ABD6J568_9LACO|nr:DUF805 domain-containing protein [Ligilactobacillus salivarius]AKI05283.1 membrane protein [Ligilactobacillus salivarius str. Ren]MDE1498837.1 DUF805 domain-containing protein [Ligilactobacillus salivarius]MDE1500164.1 DUF805 domain-containing protein [Ligilactobacillus salivarius]MDE1523649.1 DUF805 domain-containing protein [Ligilactobacillus salivarius]MDE1542820.1 DUF805 domain-containing protein [Ligilactobacillus salivarius]
MFCTKCGAKNPEDATFCYKCGNEMYTDKTRTMVDDTTDTTDEIVAEEVNPLIDFWTNIVNFEGKMNRHNFWVAVFIMALINIVIVAISYGTEAMILWYLYDLFFLIATLSASVRRLHDINKSGAYVLLNLIPLVGQVALLIMLLQENEVDKKKVVDDPINNMDDKGFYLTAAVFIGIILVILLPLLLNGTL